MGYFYGNIEGHSDFHTCMAAIQKWMAAARAQGALGSDKASASWEQFYVEVMGSDYNRVEAKASKRN